MFGDIKSKWKSVGKNVNEPHEIVIHYHFWQPCVYQKSVAVFSFYFFCNCHVLLFFGAHVWLWAWSAVSSAVAIMMMISTRFQGCRNNNKTGCQWVPPQAPICSRWTAYPDGWLEFGLEIVQLSKPKAKCSVMQLEKLSPSLHSWFPHAQFFCVQVVSDAVQWSSPWESSLNHAPLSVYVGYSQRFSGTVVDESDTNKHQRRAPAA